MDAIYLPKLNRLHPTIESTVFKITEETGELARAVLGFLPVEQSGPAGPPLQDVANELLDVAQTCVTMIFVLEDCCGIQADTLVRSHLEKLENKGYEFDKSQTYCIKTAGHYKSLHLPRLQLPGVTLLTTVCKIQEELGELTQYLGKHAAASGEKSGMKPDEALRGCAGELLDVAQCCFTMMYILVEKYSIDIPALVAGHVAKLRRKGYCV